MLNLIEVSFKLCEYDACLFGREKIRLAKEEDLAEIIRYDRLLIEEIQAKSYQGADEKL